MSDLNPKGALIEIGGEKRHLLFTLNVIDEIQSTYNTTIFEALQDLADPMKQPKAIKYFMMVLLNDEAMRMRYKHPDCTLKELTEDEVGHMISREELTDVVSAILKAYGISMPEPDERDKDPN